MRPLIWFFDEYRIVFELMMADPMRAAAEMSAMSAPNFTQTNSSAMAAIADASETSMKVRSPAA